MPAALYGNKRVLTVPPSLRSLELARWNLSALLGFSTNHPRRRCPRRRAIRLENARARLSSRNLFRALRDSGYLPLPFHDRRGLRTRDIIRALVRYCPRFTESRGVERKGEKASRLSGEATWLVECRVNLSEIERRSKRHPKGNCLYKHPGIFIRMTVTHKDQSSRVSPRRRSLLSRARTHTPVNSFSSSSSALSAYLSRYLLLRGTHTASQRATMKHARRERA